MGVQWFSTSLTFYGVMWYATGVLPGSPFVKLLLLNGARIVCSPLVVVGMQRLGKRWWMLTIWVTGGVCVAVLAILPEETPIWQTMTVTVVAGTIFDASYTAVYTFT